MAVLWGRSETRLSLPPSVPRRTPCLVHGGFSEQLADGGLSGWLRDLCKEVAQAGETAKKWEIVLRCQARGRPQGAAAELEHSWEPDPCPVCSAPGAALVLACQAVRTDR